MTPDESLTQPSTGSVRPDEIEQTLDADELGFGSRLRPEFRQAVVEASDATRTVASRDGGDIVGVAVSVPSEMTLPGLEVVPTAAVVGVAVWPTHRRQGRLRSMMRYQVDDLRARGDWIAVLTSSEAPIYQRFGYGPATLATSYTIESRAVSVEPPGGARRSAADGGEADGRSGRVRFVTREEAAKVFPTVLERYQRTRAGEVARLSLGWFDVLGDPTPEDQRARFYVVHDDGGEVQGYASYRIVVEERGRRQRVLKLDELCSTSAFTYEALWAYLVDVDLISRIDTGGRPIDEPIRWALSDYRRMRPLGTSEHTFVRLIDVERALAARRYEDEGSLVLSVTDRFCPWNEGTYRITVAGDHGGGGGEAAVEVEREGEGRGRRPDIRLDVSALASMYLGGIRPSALAQVGLVEELVGGALDVADHMFVGPVPPYCTTSF